MFLCQIFRAAGVSRTRGLAGGLSGVLVEPCLDGPARPEIDLVLFRDLDRFAGAGIAPNPGAGLPRGESRKAAQFDPFTLRQSLGYVLEYGIDRRADVFPVRRKKRPDPVGSLASFSKGLLPACHDRPSRSVLKQAPGSAGSRRCQMARADHVAPQSTALLQARGKCRDVSP